MNLIRDVLDNQLVDRGQRKMGKVDGVVLEVRDGRPPRVAYIEQGVSVLARRFGPRLGDWLRRWRRDTREDPFRIPWSDVRDVGIDVEIDTDAEALPTLAWEQWLRRHIIGRIPGGG